MNKPMTPYYVEPEDLSTTDRTRREDFTQRGIVHKPVYLAADVDVELTALQQQLATTQAKIVELEQQLAIAQARIVELEQQLAVAQARIVELEQQLATTNAHLEAQRTATYQAVEREHLAKQLLAKVTGHKIDPILRP